MLVTGSLTFVSLLLIFHKADLGLDTTSDITFSFQVLGLLLTILESPDTEDINNYLEFLAYVPVAVRGRFHFRITV